MQSPERRPEELDMSYSEEVLLTAHRHCVLNAAEIASSEQCGCFYCTSIYGPADVTEWIEDRRVLEGTVGKTALCPKCRIDSVIGSASGFPITSDFLRAMRERWFER